MNYIRNNFKDGDILYAETLNNMDNGIYRLASAIGALPGWSQSATKPEYDISEIKNSISINEVNQAINTTVSKVGLTGLYSDLIGAPQISDNEIDFNAYALKTDLDKYYLKTEPLVKTISTLNGGNKSGAVTITAADLGAVQLKDLATVASTGSYKDLLDKPSTYVERSELSNAAFTGNYADLKYAPIFLDSSWITAKEEKSALNLFPTVGNEYTLYIVTYNGTSTYYRWNCNTYQQINNMIVTNSYTTNERFKILETTSSTLTKDVNNLKEQLSKVEEGEALVIDQTFTNEWQAADAKLTGERLQFLEDYVDSQSGGSSVTYLTQEMGDAMYVQSAGEQQVTYKNCQFLTETYPNSGIWELSPNIVVTANGEENISDLINSYGYKDRGDIFTIYDIYDTQQDNIIAINNEINNRIEDIDHILNPDNYALFNEAATFNIGYNSGAGSIRGVYGSINTITGESNFSGSTSVILQNKQDIGSLAGQQIMFSLGYSNNYVFRIFFYDGYNNLVKINYNNYLDIDEGAIFTVPAEAVNFNLSFSTAIPNSFSIIFSRKTVREHSAIYLTDKDKLYIENNSIDLLEVQSIANQSIAYSFYVGMMFDISLWPEKVETMIPADRVAFYADYISTFYKKGYWDASQVQDAVDMGFITEMWRDSILAS